MGQDNQQRQWRRKEDNSADEYSGIQILKECAAHAHQHATAEKGQRDEDGGLPPIAEGDTVGLHEPAYGQHAIAGQHKEGDGVEGEEVPPKRPRQVPHAHPTRPVPNSVAEQRTCLPYRRQHMDSDAPITHEAPACLPAKPVY